mgnify:FL=1|jgi:hypothetical protein
MTNALCETENELRDMDNMIGMFVEQVSLGNEYDKESTVIGFGEFLLCEGKIDAHELESAFRFQEVEHVDLGELAVQEKFLTEWQSCIILDSQGSRGGFFGEIAVELGFMNKDDVSSLLKKQSEKHIKIGEVLVMFGAISREEMELQLQKFHAHV